MSAFPISYFKEKKVANGRVRTYLLYFYAISSQPVISACVARDSRILWGGKWEEKQRSRALGSNPQTINQLTYQRFYVILFVFNARLP